VALDLELEAVIKTFREEAAEGLAAAEAALVSLERHADDPEAVNTLFRVMHTVKGNAGSLGFAAVAELAHGLEDVLDRLRKGRAVVSPGLVTALLRSVDVLRRLLATGEAGETLGPLERAALEEVLGSAGEATPAVEPAAEAPLGRGIQDRLAGRTLRVDMDKLDRMLNLTGEMAIVQGRLRQVLGSAAGSEAAEIQGEADRLFSELQELVMKARMVPVGPVFRRYVRMVRDIAVASGKLARLEIEGDEVEVDTSVVEAIRDPLTHMVRNAVDHGIEAPAVRRAAGKDPCGVVTLRASHESGSIVIQVCDDGRGLDRDRILARARGLGLIGDQAPAPADVDRLIFEPGVSTAGSVTELSGRGVGLDVVRRNVELLRGSVFASGVPGLGTAITLRLPLTLAIIAGLNVQAGDETYVIPLDTVVEIVGLDGQEGPREDGRGVLSLRGEPLPFVRLRTVFGAGGATEGREEVVVVRALEGVAGLAVDRVLGESQTVIKPLGRLFDGAPGLSGATILGDGRVALIADIGALLREELAKAGATSAAGAGAEAHAG
jgi:two-component system chemotaxis sensor kinase CheA